MFINLDPKNPGNFPVISRHEAAVMGRVFYYTGRACKHGHYAQRYVSTDGCLECLNRRRRVIRNGRRVLQIEVVIPDDAAELDYLAYNSAAQLAVTACASGRGLATGRRFQTRVTVPVHIPIGVGQQELEAITGEFQQFIDASYFGPERIYVGEDGKHYVYAIAPDNSRYRFQVWQVPGGWMVRDPQDHEAHPFQITSLTELNKRA